MLNCFRTINLVWWLNFSFIAHLLLCDFHRPVSAQVIGLQSIEDTSKELNPTHSSGSTITKQEHILSLDPEPESIKEDISNHDSVVSEFKVSPRGGAGFTTEGAGVKSFGNIEGFIPLRQRAGKDLTFVELRLLIDDDVNLGSNALLGHRFYHSKHNRTYGGYISFDTRSTNTNIFSQIGLGLETQGDFWDARVNGYIPLERSRLVSDITTNLGESLSTRFQGNFLLLERALIRQRTQLYEGPLPGVDVELALKLAQWSRGNFRAFAGGYYYDGLGATDALGWRLGFRVEPTENFALSLSVQDDGLFGTNIVGAISGRLPGIRPKKKKSDKQQRVVARLGEPVQRTNSITLGTRTIISDMSAFTSAPLMNPEEEQPYLFQHVELGAATGNGTVENPFGTVQEALNATIGDGNDIVYVGGTVNSQIPAFTIPDRVRVLSQGPKQFIAGLPFPGFPRRTNRLPFSTQANFSNGITVELPFSGDGIFPSITGGGADLVTLGNRTVLAGFQIQNASGNGVIGRNINTVELRNNIISNSGERGIFLEDVGGSVVLLNNIVTGSMGTGPNSGQGLLIRNTKTLSGVTATIQGFQFDRNRIGIEASAIGSRTPREAPNQVITIGPSNSANTSIGTQNNVPIINSVSNNREQGLLVQAKEIGSQEVTITGSQIRNNGASGIEAVSGTSGGALTATQEIFISNNQIEANRADGIRAVVNEAATQELAINDNEIRNNTGAGIRATARNVSTQEFTTDASSNSNGISRNIISGNGAQGIFLEAFNVATQASDINSNQIANNNTATGGVGSDIALTANSVTNKICVVPNNNLVPSGLKLTTTTIPIFGGADIIPVFQVGDLANVSRNNNNAPVVFENLTPGASTANAFQDLSASTCFP